MDPLCWLYLTLSILLIFVNGYFSMAETAFSCLNKFKFQVQAQKGNRTAKLVMSVADHFDTTMTTISVVINALSVALSAMSTFLFLHWLPGFDDVYISLLASVVVTAFLYFFGETIPKQIARKIPNKIAVLTVYPLLLFIFALYPISLLFRLILFINLRLFRSKPEPEITEDDFASVIDVNKKHGLLKESESDLIHASFDFSDTSVKNVLTPKEKMYEIDLKGLTSQKLVDILCSTNYSRIPVYFGEKNKIVGILLVKEYLSRYLRDPKTDIKESLEKPYIVSSTITMDALTDGFRTYHTHIALVYDKSGDLIGMVTMEDVLEELVGPIDEKAAPVREQGNSK